MKKAIILLTMMLIAYVPLPRHRNGSGQKVPAEVKMISDMESARMQMAIPILQVISLKQQVSVLLISQVVVVVIFS